MNEFPQDVVEMVQIVKLQGHKKLIWDELSFPRTNRALKNALSGRVPYDSVRRCLSEMKRDKYIEKKEHNQKKGIVSHGKWQRKENRVNQQ